MHSVLNKANVIGVGAVVGLSLLRGIFGLTQRIRRGWFDLQDRGSYGSVQLALDLMPVGLEELIGREFQYDAEERCHDLAVLMNAKPRGLPDNLLNAVGALVED